MMQFLRIKFQSNQILLENHDFLEFNVILLNFLLKLIYFYFRILLKIVSSQLEKLVLLNFQFKISSLQGIFNFHFKKLFSINLKKQRISFSSTINSKSISTNNHSEHLSKSHYLWFSERGFFYSFAYG